MIEKYKHFSGGSEVINDVIFRMALLEPVNFLFTLSFLSSSRTTEISLAIHTVVAPIWVGPQR